MDYIDKLRVFRSVVEMRSFTRAADMHGLARPVARAVADLEARSAAGCCTDHPPRR